MKKYNFVYKTTNNLNGDYYYGVRNYRIDLDKIEYNLSQRLKIGFIHNSER